MFASKKNLTISADMDLLRNGFNPYAALRFLNGDGDGNFKRGKNHEISTD
ncbi:MAG: hypothetical protein ACYDBW_02095 [Sulfuricaulis sp.]